MFTGRPRGGANYSALISNTLNETTLSGGPWRRILAVGLDRGPIGACYGRSMPSAVPNHEIARAIDDPPGVPSGSKSDEYWVVDVRGQRGVLDAPAPPGAGAARGGRW